MHNPKPCRAVAPACRLPRRLGGFTLIEAIVTIIIVGIVAVVVLPRFSLLSGFDQSGYRDQLLSSLDYARKAAVAARRNTCVDLAGSVATFTLDNREPDGIAGAIACGTGLPLPSSGLRGAGSNTLTAPSGVGVTTTAAITFDALGRSVARATRSPASATLTFTLSGAPPTTLVVEAETGLVH